MKTSTKLLSMFSAFCAILFLGMTANAQSITVVPGLTATQIAQTLVGSNVTVTNATYTGATNASGSFNQASSTFPLSDGIILTSGAATNALGPNNATGLTGSNGTGSDPQLASLVPGFNIFDAAVLEFDITSNCNTVTFDYIFASEEYLEYGCSEFNDAFGFFITGPGFAPNTNIALVPGTSTPVSINNVINAPGNNPPCVSNPAFYVDNAGGVSVQYDGYTVTLTATASIQPCQTYHIKIAVGDAGDSALDSAVFLKGGGINCTSPSLATTANVSDVDCAGLGAIDLSVNSGTGPFTYSWVGPNGFTATTEDISSLDAGTYTVDIVGSDCLSSGQATFTVADNADVTPPVFTNCPSDLVVEAANNACAFSVDVLSNVTVTDDCGVASLTTSHDANFVFGVGTTPVTVTATDAAGNSSTCTFNVIVNAQPLIVTLTPFQYNGGVNIRCFGQNSGRVTGAASGGCAPYTFTWSSGFPLPFGPPNTSTCAGLFSGQVTCTVTDAAGTSVTEVVTLVENPPVVSTTTFSPIPCFGGTSTVTVSAQAGTAPYNGLTVTDVFAGTYEYVVADANGCRAYDTLVITQPDILDVTATPEPILCFGDTTTVTVAGTGGTLPYTGAGLYQEVAGTYMYNVTDANGCSENITLAINQPAQLTAMISNTPILCNGGTSQVTVSVASGTEPYTGTGVFTETAGYYTYTVLDFNLCEDTIGVLITEPEAMVSTISATPILCNGDSTTITITPTGGTGSWNGIGTFIEAAGTYDYSFTDQNGCVNTNSITVTEPTQLVVSTTATSIDCNGGTADITVSATGGTPSYTGTGTFTVTAGTYTYTVTDANGCSETVTVTVSGPSALSASATATSIDCNGGSADITVSATGGTAPYTGTGVYSVSAGTYDYTVTDANGCSETVSITVTEPTQLVASISATSIDCNGGSADITVSATGGTAPYTGTGVYSVTAGTYDYTVTDANGCSETVSITVTEPTQLVASISATSIDCNGGSADITVSATGGTAPYTGTGVYSVTAGTYDYTVTDANGCSETVSITVTEPTQLVASISATSIDCNGGSADITVSATGGTAPYTGTGVYSVTAGTYDYTVTDANGCSETVSITVTEPTQLVASISATSIDCNGGSADITVSATGGTAPYTGTGVYSVTAGTYDYTVTDANGCSETVSITVTEPTQLVASISATSIDCNGGSADITVSATGGTAPYTGTGVYSVTAGTYDYTVTDANGCSETVSITVTEPTQLVASISATSIDCNGGSADITVSATGGTAPYTGTGVYSVSAGTYTYTVTDANGCSETVSITVTEPTVLTASATATLYSCVSGLATVTVSAVGGTAPYSGVGNFNEGLGTYTYTVTDANGCTATASVTISEIPASITIVGAPSNATVECDAVPTAPTVTAVGTNGENINVTFTENTIGSGCTYQIVRTWTAVDSCGNQMVSTQTLNVQDTQAPVIACPADYSIDCNNPWIPLSSVVVTTTDCSNNVTTSVSDSIVTGSGFASQTIIYRTITASDDCGNVSSCTQVITGTPVLTEGECKKCDTEISIVVDPFNPSCVSVSSLCKDLSNVVLGDINGWEYKFDGLNGYTGYFCHPSGLPITDVWVKAGCYRSGDGPGYGHHFDVCGPGGPTGPVTYDPSAGLNTSYEWIDNVSLGSINNLSGNNGGYGDFSTLATGASVGDIVSLQLTPGFTGVSYDEYWRVWIDWNNDGDFVDAGEQVYQNNATVAVMGSFTVPATATTNTDLRVRVAMKWDAYSTPSEMFQYGEVEDYTIFVQDGGGIGGMQTTIGSLVNDKGVKQEGKASNDIKSNEVNENVINSGYGIELGDVYPNPVLSANGKFNLDIRTNSTDVTIRIVDLSGRVILTEEMYLGIGANKCQLDVTGFTRGSYLIEVLSGKSKETTQLVVQ